MGPTMIFGVVGCTAKMTANTTAKYRRATGMTIHQFMLSNTMFAA